MAVDLTHVFHVDFPPVVVENQSFVLKMHQQGSVSPVQFPALLVPAQRSVLLVFCLQDSVFVMDLAVVSLAIQAPGFMMVALQIQMLEVEKDSLSPLIQARGSVMNQFYDLVGVLQAPVVDPLPLFPLVVP